MDTRTALPSPPRTSPFGLALLTSLVAVTGATVAHLGFAVGERPIVLATIVGSSVVGWANVARPLHGSGRRRPA